MPLSEKKPSTEVVGADPGASGWFEGQRDAWRSIAGVNPHLRLSVEGRCGGRHVESSLHHHHHLHHHHDPTVI